MFEMINLGLLSYITLRLYFVFFNYGESTFLYEIDLLAITVCTAFIGYFLQKHSYTNISNRNKVNENEISKNNNDGIKLHASN